uniref:G-protein coupled receptors family 1 profile domain-containing protein n=1 Tax=Hippocampus comes TaxID=109280 RepID=A0A3Q2Z819_HIPCM
MDMPEDRSFLKNQTEHGPETSPGGARPAWAVTALASVLIFTTVVDVLGNLLVIISVARNRKLRNVAKLFAKLELEENTPRARHEVSIAAVSSIAY